MDDDLDRLDAQLEALWPQSVASEEARDAVDAKRALARVLAQKLEQALNPETITPRQLRRLLRWARQTPTTDDFRVGIPQHFAHLLQLAGVLRDAELAQHVVWTTEAFARWVERVQEVQEGRDTPAPSP